MTWKEAVLRRFEEKTRSLRSIAGRIGVTSWPRMYVATREASRNTNSNTMEPDRPQHDRPAASVVAQQYSSFSFISLRFHCCKQKFGTIKKLLLYQLFFKFLKIE
jgi:hypothetical protein